MSLIDAMLEPFCLMTKVKEADGEGGFITSWTEGAEFMCAMTLNTSMTARIAEKDGFTNLYTATTKREVELEYHEAIKRKRDGKIFRITSDGSDTASPMVSSLNMRQYNAENWRLS